ncbi:MAG: glycosyltransferase family 4 protein [Bacteroidota bacterium]
MKTKILIVCREKSSSFVQLDADILASEYDVEILYFSALRNPKILWIFLTLGLKLTQERVSCIMMWFSVPHLAPVVVILAKIFRVKVLAITGGFDVAYVPAIGWGEMGSRWKRTLQRFTLRRVDRVLPFSDFSRADTLRYAPENITSTLYPGIDLNRFTPSGKKDDVIITTCNAINRSSIVQKGLDVFARCAATLPEFNFLVIGKVETQDVVAEEFVRNAPENLRFTGKYVSDDELLQFYQRARVYVQASAHEGFGIACAEAMACGCIPVGTYNTSLPEVIGNTGYLVPYNDVPAIVNAIRSAMKLQNIDYSPRKRVEENFSIEKRRAGLLSTMNQILGN